MSYGEACFNEGYEQEYSSSSAAQAAGGMTTNRRERFIDSKCDRCGRTTPANQNGIGDLFTLPEEWPELYDGGSFASAALVSIRGGLGCVVRQSALGSPPLPPTHARRAGRAAEAR